MGVGVIVGVLEGNGEGVIVGVGVGGLFWQAISNNPKTILSMLNVSRIFWFLLCYLRYENFIIKHTVAKPSQYTFSGYAFRLIIAVNLRLYQARQSC